MAGTVCHSDGFLWLVLTFGLVARTCNDLRYVCLWDGLQI